MSLVRTGRILRFVFRAFLRIDAEQHVQPIAMRRLLQLERLIRDLEVFAPERGVDRVITILYAHRRELAVPCMTAILRSTDHPAELGPLIVDGPLHERGDRIVNPDDSFATLDEVQQRRAQRRIVEQDSQGRLSRNGVIHALPVIGLELP